ncbi:MAG: AraC family transcriptional regulator [Chitinophagales bacterium]|nr:AraC family transcriptional regulator [Chitinophagales bacterium]
MSAFLVYSSITGILLSFIFFFFNRGYRTANRYLAGFFFFISLFVLSQYSGLYGDSEVLAALLASAPTPFVFLIGPFSFLYVRSVLRDNTRLSKTDYLHFVLFILELAGMMSYYFSSWDYKLSVARVLLSENWQVTHLNLNTLFVSPVNSYLRPLHLLIYLLMQWWLIRKYYRLKGRPSVPVLQQRVMRRWLLFQTITFSVFLLCFALISVYLFVYETRTTFRTNSWILLFIGALDVIVLTLCTLLFPKVLYGLPKIYVPEVPEQTEQPSSVSHMAVQDIPVQPEEDSKKSGWVSGIEKKLNDLYAASTPWTDKHFSIRTLSIELQEPEHHLRYYFNHHLQISFTVYRNRLRIAHAKKLLQDPANSHLSIEGIGAMSGFPSKSGFFALFRQETGMTPSEYQKKMLEEE